MSIHFTGAGIVSPLGHSVQVTMDALEAGRSSLEHVEEWAAVDGLSSHVAARVNDFDNRFIPRKVRRTMSKMSEMLCKATSEALSQANLSLDEVEHRRVMLLVGSTTGSTETFEVSFKKFHESGSSRGQFSTTMFKTMNHSVALNLASYLQFKGTVISPSSACSTGAQAILLGAQFIESGLCDIALCGGADEVHVGTAIAFDTAQAASSGFNGDPKRASRPFDAQRDGVVVAEGASLVVLESADSMRSRSAQSLGEICGWAQSCDGGQVAHSGADSMAQTMQDALSKAGIGPEDVGYVNAHATATLLGDLYESQAVHTVFGDHTPISSLKGHLGHSFAPCGTMEAIATLHMLRTQRFLPTLNLEEIDPELPALGYLREVSSFETEHAMSNNFAMGGMNVSLILRAPDKPR